MKKQVKKGLAVSLAVILSLLIWMPVFAEEVTYPEDEIETENYTTINRVSCTLDISGITAVMSAALTSQTSTSLCIKMELQKLKSGTYSTIETYTKTGTGRYLDYSASRLINALSTYRLKTTFTAGSETVVAYAYP